MLEKPRFEGPLDDREDSFALAGLADRSRA